MRSVPGERIMMVKKIDLETLANLHPPPKYEEVILKWHHFV
jgi:hypothetical protein